jgi:hypothetical protein
MFSLPANGERIGASDDTPVLWVLRDVLNLNGRGLPADRAVWIPACSRAANLN